jgi:ureidoacrylate peracid hydrolase
MSLRERVNPGVSRRKDFPLESRKAALLIIDVQQYLMPTTTTTAANSSSSPSDKDETEDERKERLYYTGQTSAMIKNIQNLAAAFRAIRDDTEAAKQHPQQSTGGEVIFVYLKALTNDARDISLDYKLSGPLLCNIPTATTPFEDIFLKELQPDPVQGKGDILISKTSCSVFQSTNLDYVLRNLNVEQLVITGQLTDQCIESAVRDAADLGFLVTLVEDACAAETLDAHLKGLHGVKGFCRILQTAQVMDELLEDHMKEQRANAAAASSGSGDHRANGGGSTT